MKNELISASLEQSKAYFQQVCKISAPANLTDRIFVNQETKSIEYMDLSELDIETFDLELFLQFESLQEVNLRKTKITKVDLTSLQEKPIFDEISWYITNIKIVLIIEKIKFVFDKQKIQILFTLYGKHMDDTQFESKYSVGLRALELQAKKLKSIDLTPLKLCKYLRLVNLYYNGLEKLDLGPLSYCSNLQDLSFHSNRITEIDFTPLAQCSFLLYLHFMNNQICKLDLTPLAKCTNLMKFDGSNNLLTEIDLTPFTNSIFLTKLALSENKLVEIDLSPLKKCTGLRQILLHSNEIRTLDLSPLKELPVLEWLEVHGNKLTDIDLSPLTYCTNLYGVALSENPMTRIDISPLTRASKLQRSKYMILGGYGTGLFLDTSTEIQLSKHMKDKILSPDILELVEKNLIHWTDVEFSFNENNPLYKYSIGYLMFQDKKLEEAIRIFEGIREVDPYVGNLEYDLSFLYYYTYKEEKAYERLTNILKTNPANSEFWRLWKKLYLVSLPDVPPIDKGLLEYITTNEISPYADYSAGTYFLSINELEKAEFYLKKCLINDKSDYQTWYQLAIVYYNKHQYIDAKGAVEESLKISYTYKHILTFAKRVYQKLDQKEEEIDLDEELKALEEYENQQKEK